MNARRLISAAVAAMLICTLAGAQSLSGAKDRKARLERDIKVLERQLNEANARKDNAATQLSLLRAQTAARRELLNESERELGAINDSIRVCRKQIDETQARLDTMTRYYGRLVKTSYKNRDSRIWYVYLLASENLAQGMRRYGYLRQLSSRMNAQGRMIKEERDRLEARQNLLDSLRVQARQLRDSRAEEFGKLRREEDKSRDLVARLQRDRDKYQKQLSGKRREVEALNREIERLIREEIDGTGGSGKGGGKKVKTKIDYVLSDKFASNKGKLPWPADGRIVSHFGRNPHPVYTKLEMPFNNGVGIAVDKDAPVKAVFNGVVKQIVVVPGYNQCILVQHGEYFTFYCKLGSVTVKAGDKVKTGQVIGQVAQGMEDTQLHFQLWKGKQPQDPEAWLR